MGNRQLEIGIRPYHAPKRKRYSSELENPFTMPRKSTVVSST